jgi:hypothetical protein
MFVRFRYDIRQLVIIVGRFSELLSAREAVSMMGDTKLGILIETQTLQVCLLGRLPVCNLIR